MKKKIIINVFNKETKEIVINERDPEYLRSLSLYPSRTFRDKTKYSRKKKHKGRNPDLD